MAIDKKLIQSVKQACYRLKAAGFSVGIEKLAGPIRRAVQAVRGNVQARQQARQGGQPNVAAPRPQAAAPITPVAAPAAAQHPLPSYDDVPSREAYQQAPQGMQRYRHDTTGEVYYAPSGEAAHAYQSGGDAAAHGIQPGVRSDFHSGSPETAAPPSPYDTPSSPYDFSSPEEAAPPAPSAATQTGQQAFKNFNANPAAAMSAGAGAVGAGLFRARTALGSMANRFSGPSPTQGAQSQLDAIGQEPTGPSYTADNTIDYSKVPNLGSEVGLGGPYDARGEMLRRRAQEYADTIDLRPPASPYGSLGKDRKPEPNAEPNAKPNAKPNAGPNVGPALDSTPAARGVIEQIPSSDPRVGPALDSTPAARAGLRNQR